jgi:hypothetical protein
LTAAACCNLGLPQKPLQIQIDIDAAQTVKKHACNE